MTEYELDALARRVAQYLRDCPEIALGQFDCRQVLPVTDAIRAVSLTNDTSFYNWCKKYLVPAFRHGQYRRRDLLAGLALEASVMAMRARRGRRKKRQKVIKEIIAAEPPNENSI